jgi:ubiquinone/menaquinone biosynthesis C-methylase UbiE
MISWTVPFVLVVLALAALSFTRLNIPRDPDQEEEMEDPESVRAYDAVSHWKLYSIIRYLVIRQLDMRQPRGTLLDIGCGPGHLALAIARKYPCLKIIGIDNSQEMLQLALKNRASLEPGAPVQFQEADVRQLPLPADSTEFAISTLSLHHWSNPDRALAEIYRVLRPGGQLLIFDLRRDTPRILFYIFRFGQRFLSPPAIRRTNGAVGSVWSSYTIGEMEKLLSESPFQSWKVQRGWGWAYLRGQK